MSQLFDSKCRYLAEFKVFEDFDRECQVNLDFIDFVHNTLSEASYQISKEIEAKTFLKQTLKSPLSKQIREELLNFVSALNSNTLEKMNQLLDLSRKQLDSLKDRTQIIIQNSKQFLSGAESYFTFYKGKLHKNLDEIQSVSTIIKNLNKEEIVKTKQLQGKGKSLDKIQRNRYESKKEVLAIQISSLEKSNKRFRSDVHIETERLGHSYEHLTNTLVKELKRSETKMVDIISKLLYSMDSFIKPVRTDSSIVNEANLEQLQRSNKQNVPKSNVMFASQNDQNYENLGMPTFPGKESKDIGHQLDSLFFSKSIDQ